MARACGGSALGAGASRSGGSCAPRRGTLEAVFGEILWTLESEVHIARHGVMPDEVEEALCSRPRLVEPSRDESRLAFCGTTAGRYWFGGG